MNSGRYILKGHEAVEEPDLLTWGRWFETADRLVAGTTVARDDTRVRISTVFLGVDHAFGGRRPLVFETLVIGGSLDGEMARYTTWDEAVSGHHAMVARVAAAPPESTR